MHNQYDSHTIKKSGHNHKIAEGCIELEKRIVIFCNPIAILKSHQNHAIAAEETAEGCIELVWCVIIHTCCLAMSQRYALNCILSHCILKQLLGNQMICKDITHFTQSYHFWEGNVPAVNGIIQCVCRMNNIKGHSWEPAKLDTTQKGGVR